LLAIEVDSGAKTCQDCPWHTEEGDCDLFRVPLEEDVLRLEVCKQAEARAIDISLEACRREVRP